MKRNLKSFAFAAFASCIALCGACGSRTNGGFVPSKLSGKSKNLTENLAADPAKRTGCATDFTGGNLSFSIEIFVKAFEESKNTLVSPLSMTSALAMTANGARGRTLEEIENVFQVPMALMNENLSAYLDYLNELNSDKVTLSVADSIWMKNAYEEKIGADFLQVNKDYYDAEIYSSPFDETTVSDVNRWVENQTRGMIKDILKEISPESFMYLINALYFAGEWGEPYEKTQVNPSAFFNLDGSKSVVKMMGSEEAFFVSDENTTGFIKPYAGEKLAFAALLPDEGMDFVGYAKGLTAEKWQNLFGKGLENTKVACLLPAFTYDFDFDAGGILKSMGMPTAFDEERADFSGILPDEYNAYIGSVFQKTKIEVSEMGTKAAAATIVDMRTESIPVMPTVFLTRPFLYAIVDTENYYPLFLGSVVELNAM